MVLDRFTGDGALRSTNKPVQPILLKHDLPLQVYKDNEDCASHSPHQANQGSKGQKEDCRYISKFDIA